MNHAAPVPENESGRILKLAEYDLDYTNLNDNFKDLLTLAAKTAGMEISLVNLIDTYTQWTVSAVGTGTDPSTREDSVCQYVVASGDRFEVKDLSVDDRFKEKDYVLNDPNYRYYFGVPIKTSDGFSIGALCVIDYEARTLSPEKIEMLEIIANEIVNRLNTLKEIDELKNKVTTARETQKRVAHDIRGPIGGIIGLARMISEQGDENTLDDVLEFINLIQKSGNSILELADEILSNDPSPNRGAELGAGDFNQVVLKEKLLKLYALQAQNKQVKFIVLTSSATEVIPFRKNKLLQILGNIISNAIKFTSSGGTVEVMMAMRKLDEADNLVISIRDTGVGMTNEQVDAILNGGAATTDGTDGEKGYGFGLGLVKHLVDSLSGKLEITSEPGKGTTFKVTLPQEAKPGS